MKIKNYKEWDYTLILVALVIAIAMLSSCRSGYGCHGTGKLITRVKGNGY